MKRTLLIDADVFAFKAAAGVEKIITLDDDNYFPMASIAEGLSAFDNLIDEVLRELDASRKDCVYCFSTDHNGGFRREVLPSYKANRDGKPRPIILSRLREWIMNDPFNIIYIRDGLEADDCLGILSTQKSYKPDHQKIIVSVDKDMKSIPCNFFNAMHPELGVMHISEEEADRWFYMQTLMGDTTDGYSGCPGIGAKSAEKLLDKDCSWETVKTAYEKAGLSEEEAITQARVARILRASDYDFKNKRVKLWTPPR